MSSDTKKKNFFEKQFSKIDSVDTAREFATLGAIAAFSYAFIEVGGMARAYFIADNGRHLSLFHYFIAEQGQELSIHILATVILTPILLFMSWRIKTGKGYISALLLLLLTLSGIFTGNVWWFFSLLFLAGAFVNGARGCWYLRNIKKQEEQDEKSGMVTQ